MVAAETAKTKENKEEVKTKESVMMTAQRN